MFLKSTGEVIATKCKPTAKSLQNKFIDFQKKFPECEIESCYEATYIGFTLQRDLEKYGFNCRVVAPSSIPRVHCRKSALIFNPCFEETISTISLKPEISRIGSSTIFVGLSARQMKWLMYALIEYDKSADELAGTEKYQKQVNALICYHGIKNSFAMVMITEIGDIKRFAHPNQLSSWMGFA